MTDTTTVETTAEETAEFVAAEFIEEDGTTKDEGMTLAEIAKTLASDATKSYFDDPRTNGEIMQANDIRLVHVMPHRGSPQHRGVSVAWRRVNRNVIEIATSVVHTNDAFTRRIGGRIAIVRLMEGHSTLMPIHAKYDVANTLQRMFNVYRYERGNTEY